MWCLDLLLRCADIWVWVAGELARVYRHKLVDSHVLLQTTVCTPCQSVINCDGILWQHMPARSLLRASSATPPPRALTLSTLKTPTACVFSLCAICSSSSRLSALFHGCTVRCRFCGWLAAHIFSDTVPKLRTYQVLIRCGVYAAESSTRIRIF